MSIQFSGNILLATPANNLMVNQAATSLSCFLSVVSTTGTSPDCSGTLVTPAFQRGTNLVYVSSNVLKFNFENAAGQTNSNTEPISLSTVYHLALVWTAGLQTIYINGIAVANLSLSGNCGYSTNQPLYVGFSPVINPSGQTVFQVENLAYWNGYALSPTDVLALRDQTATPATLGTAATSWWTFQGTNSNPVSIGDPGITDKIGTVNFTSFAISKSGSYASTSNNGTITYAPSLTYTSPVTTSPYVSKNGVLFFPFYATTPPYSLTNVKSVGAMPTVYVNGTAVPITGPFWASNTNDICWVAYQFNNPISSSSTVTYSAPDNWVITQAGPAGAVTQASVLNSIGSLEPAAGSGAPMSPPPSKTMLLGCNFAWPVESWGSQYSPTLNWMHRAFAPWQGALSTAVDGRPITVNGYAQAAILSTNGNAIDGSDLPAPTGTWTFIADETAPQTPMTVQLVTFSSGSVSITAGPMTAGIIDSSGVERGKMWQWNVSYSSNPTTWNPQLLLRCTAYNATSPGNYTLENEFLFSPTINGPAPPLNRSNPLAMDQNLVNAATTPSQRTPACIRLMDMTESYLGFTNIVDPSDLRPSSYLSWANSPIGSSGSTNTRTITLTTVRNYNLTNSPVIYTSQWGTPQPSGSPGPYALTIPSSTGIGYLAAGGLASQWYVAEFVTSAPHGLKTGQIVTFGPGTYSFPVSNGSTSTVTMTTLNNQQATVFVTGASTFAVTLYSGLITNGTGSQMPGGMNNVVGANTITATASIVVPDSNTLPYDAAARVVGTLPNTGLWVNIPAAATDACVTTIANLVLANSSIGTPKYIEYSNEHWNGGNIQSRFMMYALGQLGFGALPGQTTTSIDGAYTYRAKQIHDIFASVFAGAGRGGEIVRVFGGMWAGSNVASNMIAYANASLAANPSTPIQIDAIAIAPYLAMNTDQYADPKVQATVNPSGGGTSGGNLAAGTYYVSYTWLDPVSGQETSPGTSQSSQFTVAAGDIPQVTIAFPGASGSRNWTQTAKIYLTPTNGAAGSEIYYSTYSNSGLPVNTATVTLSAAAPTSGPTPPPHSQIPSFNLAAASIWKSNPNSIAYAAPITPWTRPQYADLMRHYFHYSTNYTNWTTSNVAALAAYTPVNNQPPGFKPTLISYEGSVQNYTKIGIGTNDNTNPGSVVEVITNDLLYDPSQYDVEMEFLSWCQRTGISMLTVYAFLMQPTGGSNIQVATWGYHCYPGQPWGRGDGSDGKAVNQFAMVTGKSTHQVNVAVKLQAWRDWADAANPAPPSFTLSQPRTVAARLGRGARRNGRAHLKAALARPKPNSLAKWFPGLRVNRTARIRP